MPPARNTFPYFCTLAGFSQEEKSGGLTLCTIFSEDREGVYFRQENAIRASFLRKLESRLPLGAAPWFIASPLAGEASLAKGQAG